MMAPLADAAELCRLGVADLTAGYATGRFSPVEVARACLDRAAVVQHRCNAFVFVDEAGALAAAAESETRWRSGTPASRIDGAPTTLKDIVGVRDWTLTYGSRAADPVHSREDAPAVALLRQAGAVFLGLTRMPEFGWKAVTDSPAGGITRNPRDPSLTAGGSSGGAAAAAASGAGVLHLGTDGGGSIRIPAAFCGVVGHKPTFGRVPAWPPSAFGTVAHLGPITRSVADAMAMLDVMSGRDLRDWHQTVMPFPPVTGARCELAGLRLGVWDVSPGVGITSAIAASFSVACARLTAAGALLEPVALPPEDLMDLFRTLWLSGAAQRLRTVATERHHLLDPGFAAAAAEGAAMDAGRILTAGTRRAAWAAALDRLVSRHDALISPAVAVQPFAAGAEVPVGSGLARWFEWAGFSFPLNLGQHPACVLPCAADGSSLQIVGARGRDDRVLGMALAMEQAFASG